MTLLGSALVVLGTFMLMIYLAPVTTDAIGLDASRMPLVLFAYGIGALIGNYGCGWMVDRFGARTTMTIVITALILLLAALPLVPMVPVATREPVFLVYILCFGALTWGFFPGQLLRLASLAPGSVPLVASLNLTAANVGGAVASLIGGVALQHWGLTGLGLGGAAIVALALVVALAVKAPAG
jgi:predicted MFS family arabinose efflux permease